LWRGK
jgi:hypothetical protein